MDVTVLTSVDNLSEIESDWNSILETNQANNFYYSYDWIHAACHFFIQPVPRPFIVRIREDNKPVAIIPCCITRKRLRLFSYNSLELIGNIYSAYRGGIILKGREQDVATIFINFLLEHRSIWHILNFEDMPESDPFLKALDWELKHRRMIVQSMPQYAKLVIESLQGNDSSDYWQSLGSNLKQQIRRSINRMNREGSVIIVPTVLPDQDIESAMNHYYDVYTNSWKEPEMDPDFHRKLARYLLPKNKLRLFTLYFKSGKKSIDILTQSQISSYESLVCPANIPDGYLPLATAFYAVNGSYACFLKTAYRQDYARYSAGTVLTWFVVKWLLDKDRTTLIDFQKEDDPYKFKWGKFKEMHVQILAASPRCPLAILEIWAEKNLIPLLRKIKKTRLWPIINNFLGQRDGRTFDEAIKHSGRENGDADR